MGPCTQRVPDLVITHAHGSYGGGVEVSRCAAEISAVRGHILGLGVMFDSEPRPGAGWLVVDVSNQDLDLRAIPSPCGIPD